MKFLAQSSLFLALMAFAANADQMPGKHPYYIHALSDLHSAHWLLEHQAGDAKVYADEDIAIKEIDAALGEIHKAAKEDGKDVKDHPPVDVKEHGSRLLKSIEALNKAKSDISAEEDNPEVREIRHHALEHIEKAIKAADKAHAEWLKDVAASKK